MNLFDVFRVALYGVIFLTILFAILGNSFVMSIIFATLISCVIILLLTMRSYTEVRKFDNGISFYSFTKQIHLNKIDAIYTWWAYDYGASSVDITQGNQGKARQSVNKINCFVEFVSGQDRAYVYEQIHMSGKFPNHLEYNANKEVNMEKAIKVWDIDRCLEKLDLSL